MGIWSWCWCPGWEIKALAVWGMIYWRTVKALKLVWKRWVYLMKHQYLHMYLTRSYFLYLRTVFVTNMKYMLFPMGFNLMCNYTFMALIKFSSHTFLYMVIRLINVWPAQFKHEGFVPILLALVLASLCFPCIYTGIDTNLVSRVGHGCANSRPWQITSWHNVSCNITVPS